MDRSRTVIIVASIFAVAGIAIAAIVTFGNHSTATTATSSTTRPKTTVSSITVVPTTTAVPTTTLPPTTTAPPPTTPAQTITGNSPTGPVVWQTGDPVPPTNDAYQGYYCCLGPFPDGMDRSGSAGCSGSLASGSHQGGFYINGKLC